MFCFVKYTHNVSVLSVWLSVIKSRSSVVQLSPFLSLDSNPEQKFWPFNTSAPSVSWHPPIALCSYPKALSHAFPLPVAIPQSFG